jgi:hypothetical protein
VRRCDLRFAIISWDDLVFDFVLVHSSLDPVMQIGSEFIAGGSSVIFLSPLTVRRIRLLKPRPLDISARSQQIIKCDIRIIPFAL